MFLAVIETDRFKEAINSSGTFWQEAKHCMSQVLEGPGRMMRWAVPDGTKDEITGDLVHDDELISSALCAMFDDQEWAISGPPVIVERGDPLAEMDTEGF